MFGTVKTNDSTCDGAAAKEKVVSKIKCTMAEFGLNESSMTLIL